MPKLLILSMLLANAGFSATVGAWFLNDMQFAIVGMLLCASGLLLSTGVRHG